MGINIIQFITHIISLKRLMAQTSQSVSSHALFVNFPCPKFAEQRALIHGSGGTSVPRE